MCQACVGEVWNGYPRLPFAPRGRTTLLLGERLPHAPGTLGIAALELAPASEQVLRLMAAFVARHGGPIGRLGRHVAKRVVDGEIVEAARRLLQAILLERG